MNQCRRKPHVYLARDYVKCSWIVFECFNVLNSWESEPHSIKKAIQWSYLPWRINQGNNSKGWHRNLDYWKSWNFWSSVYFSSRRWLMNCWFYLRDSSFSNVTLSFSKATLASRSRSEHISSHFWGLFKIWVLPWGHDSFLTDVQIEYWEWSIVISRSV